MSRRLQALLPRFDLLILCTVRDRLGFHTGKVVEAFGYQRGQNVTIRRNIHQFFAVLIGNLCEVGLLSRRNRRLLK